LCHCIQQEEIASLREQLQCMLRDNNILKAGIQIQHERNLEQEEKLKEVPQLNHFMSQCQEQIRKLEVLQLNKHATSTSHTKVHYTEDAL